MHAWGQGDRLALAFGFYDHGMNFWRPRTYTLSSIDGVAGVEFPLLPYLAAAGAKALGRSAIVPLYRLLTAATAWLAYVYLWRLVYERTQQFVAALVPGIFLASSPVFAYYAGNFLPDAAGTSLAIVACYYLLRFGRTRRYSALAAALGVYTLATLIKLSAGVYLVAAVGTVLLWSYLVPTVLSFRQRVGLLGMVAASGATLVGYTLYTRYLNEAFHSDLFLAVPRPLTTWAEYEQIMRRIRESWSHEYFVPFQYKVLLASVAICLWRGRAVVRTEGLWLAQLVAGAIGALLFFKLMGLQFAHHDYYVLAPFWPGLTLLVALATVQLALGLARLPGLLREVAFGALVAGLLLPGLHKYRDRMHEPYLPFSDYYTYHWMQGGAARLTAAGIPATATIMVVGDDAPNLSLVYFDRRGLVWNTNQQLEPPAAMLRQMTETGLDYLIVPTPAYRGLLARYPDLLTTFAPVLDTGQYVVLKPPHAIPHW